MAELNRETVGRWLLDNKDKQGTDAWARMSDALIKLEGNPQPAASDTAPQSRGFWSDFGLGMRQPFESVAELTTGREAAEVPSTVGSAMGRTATEAALTALPLGALASRVGPAAQGAGRIRSGIQNITSDIGRGYSANRARFLATEAGLGATAGGGGYVAEQLYPDSDAAGFVGEVLGGFAPSVLAGTVKGTLNLTGRAARAIPGPTSIVMRSWDEVKKSRSPLTASARTADRIQRALGDVSPENVLSTIGEEVLPEARELMTPAQLSGVPGLLSLERDIINSTDTLKQKSIDQLESLNNVIIGAFRQGDPEAARRGAERIRGDYLTLLNERVKLAALKTEEALERLIPGAPAEQVNRIARRELENALGSAVEQEKALFGLIDRTTPTSTTNTRQLFREMQIEAGIAGAPDIPPEATRLFGREGQLGMETTLGEMRTAQSLFRERARSARVGATPNFGMARMYDSLANAVVEDIAGITGDQAGIVADAVNFSRTKNQVFSRGQVGKILRGAADSGDVTPDALTLKNTLGMSGPAGAQAYDDIMEAVGFAASQANYGSYENMASTMEDYIRNEFMRSVVRNGEVNTNRAQTFIANNQEILARLPKLASSITEAANSKTALDAQEALRRQGAKTFDNPLTSKAALLINKGPSEAFSGVFRATNPVGEMRNLVDIVNGDTTGEALGGLKAGLFEYMLDNSLDSNGIVSGSELSTFLGNPKNNAALSQILSKSEIDNLGIISRTAQRADAARGARESIEGITGDPLSRLSQVALRLSGAVFGREVNRILGRDSLVIPAVASSGFKDAVNAGIKNPARTLIIESMGDPELFREVVLKSLILEQPVTSKGKKLLNAWLGNALLERGLSLVEDDEEEEQ